MASHSYTKILVLGLIFDYVEDKGSIVRTKYILVYQG